MSHVGNDIYRYNDEFDALVSTIGYNELTEQELLGVYKHGLNSALFKEVSAKEAEKLSTAVKIAINYSLREERNVNYVSKEINRPNTQYNKSYNNNKQSFNKYKGNDNRSQYKSYDNKSQYKGNNYKNYNNSYNKQRQFRNNNESIECYHCKQKGHIKRNCPKIRSVNNVEASNEKAICSVTSFGNTTIPNSTVKVNGTDIQAYFDTGAECSIMSTKTIKEHGFEIVPLNNLTIRTASDEIVKPLGQTKPLNVELAGVNALIQFVIMEHENHPILLGMDWFSDARATIMPVDNYITFNSRRVVMSNNAAIEYEDSAETDGDLYTDNGRPTQFSEYDETAESIGIAPEQVNVISIKTIEILSGKELKEWQNEVMPMIRERCSPGTHDIGKFNGGDMIIEIISRMPVSRPIYRRSQSEMNEIEQQNSILLKAGIIEESNSPYNNPIMAVRKKNGKIRLVNDFRGINQIIVPMTFPILMIGMILDLLSGNEYFSVLDMTSGFWQCPLEPSSRKFTAYSTPKGHYQYCVCPQGIKTGPSYFNLCVSRAMRSCKGFALNYFDDIVIFSNTVTDHLKHIKLVMKSLKQFGFKISAEKSTWIAKEVPLLGFIISGNKIKVNPDKINTIRDRPEPKNAKQVEVILGLFQFYSRFIPEFAENSKCLYNLIKKDVAWNWTEECRNAYKHFVKAITSEPAMRQPILGSSFVIYSDGSKVAIGGVLCQIQNGVEHIIEYKSRLLKGSELNYGISDIECLAVVFLVKKWHHYLYGVHFVVYTDHKALLNLMNIRDYHGRLGRQAMFLQEYQFTIKYLPGKENSGADAASRPVLAIVTRSRQQDYEQKSELEKEGYKIIDPYEDLALLHYLKYDKHNDGTSKNQVKRILKIKDKFRFKKDNETIEILKNDTWMTYPKKTERKQIILKAHLLGHFENMATIERIKHRYYWRNLYKEVEYYIQRCLTCQRNKGMTPIEHAAKATLIEHFFQRICMDIVSGLPEDKNGYCKILVIVEYMTKFVTIFPLKTKSAEEVADCLWKWISRYGPPSTILSDQGKEFVNKTLESLINKTGIERRVTSSYNPRTDGQCERMNQTVINIFKKHAEADPQRWVEWKEYVEYVYNTRKNSTTGFSPHELLYGVQPNEFIDYNETGNESEELSLFERSKQLKKLIETDRIDCLESIKKSQEYQKKVQDKRNNPTEKELKIGSKVMIKVEGLNSKLGQKYHGRYTVIGRKKGGNYILETANGKEVTQSYPITKIKPIEEDETKPSESVEIEKILNKRKNEETDTIEYLVKWKDLDEEDWVPTDHFDE